MATTAQRLHAVAVMDFMHAHAAQLDYPPGDQRTWRDNQSWNLSEQQLHHVLSSGGRWQGDCSEFSSYCLRAAGIWPWGQAGWTGSHLQLLSQHYTNGKDAYPGALVIFGPPPGHHEAIVHTPDPKGDPLVASHGRPGFDLLRVSALAAEQESMGHPGVVYLSIAHL